MVGVPELVYALTVGVVVGLGIGVMSRFDSKTLLQVLAILIFWCGVVGACGYTLIISILNWGSTGLVSFEFFFVMLLIGGGFSAILSTPISISIWYLFTRIRRTKRIKNKKAEQVGAGDSEEAV